MFTYCRTASCIPFEKKLGEGGERERISLMGWGDFPVLPHHPNKNIIYMYSHLLYMYFKKLMQIWLFGYELVDTLCVFCANEIHILSSKKKIEFLRPLESALSQKSNLPTLKLLTRNKGDADATNFINVATVMKKSKNVSIFCV